MVVAMASVRRLNECVVVIRITFRVKLELDLAGRDGKRVATTIVGVVGGNSAAFTPTDNLRAVYRLSFWVGDDPVNRSPRAVRSR